MKKTIPNSFSGMLYMHGMDNMCDASFSVSNNIVTIIPLTDECRKHNQKLSYTDGSADNDSWVFGYSDDSCSIAMLRRTRLSSSISAPVNLSVSRFYTPLIVKSISPNDVDLSTFDAIEFRGGIIDVLHMPDFACRVDENEHCIKFTDKSSYSRTYSVDIADEKIEVAYSVDISELKLEFGKTPDLRNAVHSVLRFDFDNSKQLSDIYKYYSYAMNLLQFCCGRLNVGFEIRLYKKEIRSINNKEVKLETPILVKFKDGFDDYANDMLNSINVISFNFLGEKFPRLLKILAEEQTKPHLLFLPKRNKEINNIQYTDVGDLCVAFDREFRLKSIEEKEKQDDIYSFCDEIEKFIGESKYSEELKNRAKGLIGTLKNPSPKMIISFFYDRFEKYLKIITEQKDHDKYGIVKFYSNDDFKKLISKFVDIRNKAAHKGIVWNAGTEIFVHLKILIYFSVFKRAGYSDDESAQMLSKLFGRFF